MVWIGQVYSWSWSFFLWFNLSSAVRCILVDWTLLLVASVDDISYYVQSIHTLDLSGIVGVVAITYCRIIL